MKLKCLAVDDEKFALDLLSDNIRRVPYLELVGQCKNAAEAATLLEYTKVDVVFIDIQMPGLNGLQFIAGLVPKPLVIFVTAFDQYALKAFEVDAIDYLLKPVSFERFLQASNKSLLFYQNAQATVSNVQTETIPEFIFVNVEYNLVKITLNDIVFIEGLKDYVKIHLTTQDKPILTKSTMKSLEELLTPAFFIRIHRSYIVSFKKIEMIGREMVQLTYKNIQLPIGEGHKDKLLELSKKYLR